MTAFPVCKELHI